jgi:hypothetical protein
VHEGEFIHLIEMVTGDEGIYLQQGAEEVEKGADAKQLPQDGSGADMMSRLLPVSPEEGPPLPRALGIKWPWRSDNG